MDPCFAGAHNGVIMGALYKDSELGAHARGPKDLLRGQESADRD